MERVREEMRIRKRIERKQDLTAPLYEETVDYASDDLLPSQRGLEAAFQKCAEMGVDWESYDWDTYQD